jgi:hypothetical protein
MYIRGEASQYGDIGTPYYIGKGTGRRLVYKEKAKHEIQLPKSRKNIVIVADNLSEDCAFILEKRLIQQYGRIDIGTGILRNRTNGGEGFSGLVHTPEHKAKIKEKHIANGMIKPVQCIETGMIFESSAAAGRWLIENAPEKNYRTPWIKISAVCRGENCTAYGYTWRLIGKNPTTPRKKIDINAHRRKPVSAQNKENPNEIHYFDSLWAAAEFLGDTEKIRNVKRALKCKTRTAYGYRWAYQ